MIEETGHNHIYELPEHENHRLISYVFDKRTGLKGFIAVHRKSKDFPAFGATRIWHYATDLEAANDALRLSRLMSYKAALAGLKCGGAKAVIIADASFEASNRKELLTAYAERVNCLGGNFVTGTDVGVSQDDLAVMKKTSDHIVGFNNNSTEFTALGIFESIKVALKHTYGTDSLSKHSFAIQGLGKVGAELLRLIGNDAGTLYIADIDPVKVAEVKGIYPDAIIVDTTEIHKAEVDVFSPCALSHSLNSQSITELKCKIIVGGANNQLENEAIGDLLHKLGILYAPDYVVNAGGLIAVVDEYEHKEYDHDNVLKQVLNIGKTLEKILDESEKTNVAPNLIANRMAEEIFNQGV